MHAGVLIDGRYAIEHVAGTGGMGTVYRALDRLSGCAVALKHLTGARADADRFERECGVVAELDHPRIVRYVGRGVAPDGRPYLAMEWLEGEDLATRLAREPLDGAQALALVAAVADALGHAHARGIVHRDVKPSNVFLRGGTLDGVTLLDFGVARRVESRRSYTRAGMVLGTPGYMAPEQARGQRDLDARADVFSLGCVLFECLAGRPVFVGESPVALLAKILLEEVPRLSELLAGLPAALDDLVASMLAKDPGPRPLDGNEVARAIAALGVVTGLRRSPSRRPAALTGEERRVATVLLLTLERPSTTSDDDATEPVALGPLLASAERFGGRVDSLTDGTLVATFPHVKTPTDQAVAAARFAQAARALVPGVPMAVATGRSEPGGAIPLGDAVERAAAMLGGGLAAAEPAPIVVDEATAALVVARFAVTRRGADWILGIERSDDDPVRTLVGRSTPLVGRERELATLEGLLEESIAEPVARVALVVGGAGAGKSRLRHEFVSRARSRPTGLTVWFGRGDPLSAGSPFGLVAPLLRRAIGLVEGEALAMRRRNLAAWLGERDLGEALEPVAEFLGELVGAPWSDEPSIRLRTARSDAPTMADQLRNAFEAVVAAQCRRGPLVLCLEDLHWGDPASLAFVDQALRNLATQPLLVLGLARPEVHDRFPRLWSARGIEILSLGPLTSRAGTRLVRAVLGDDFDAEVAAGLVARAGGNAFYLEELIRAVAEGRGDDLPETVLGMVSARLLELDGERRRLLRAASILGRTFWSGGVRALLGDDAGSGDIDARLADLALEEIVSRNGLARFPGESEHAFRHALVHEAAYALLTEEDRTLGHRLAAGWLTRVGETDPVVLAEHHERGGEPDRAIAWYRRAAEQALDGEDFTGAIARVERAIACGARGAELGVLRRLEATAHMWRGENEEGVARAREALDLLSCGSEAWAEAAADFGIMCGKVGRIDEVRVLLDQLLDLFRAGVAHGPLVIALLRAITQLDYAGEFALVERVLGEIAGLGEARLQEDPVVRTQLGLSRAMHRLCSGDFGGAGVGMAALARDYDAMGNRRGHLLCVSNLGFIQGELGEYEVAEKVMSEALLAADRLGLDAVGAGVRSNLGWALAQLGRLDEAEVLVRAAVVAYHAQRHPRMEGASRNYLARILAERGDREAALGELSLDVLANAPALRAYALAVRAHVLLADGRVDEALADAREGHGIVESLGGSDDGEAFVRLTHAEALHAAGDLEGAKAAIAAAKTRLVARAARIADEAQRHSFLRRVRDNARTLDVARGWGVE